MLKKLKLGLVALLLPLLAFGQSYPSPTYQNLTVLGTFNGSGNIGLSTLAAQAANTVVANVTASSASPTAVALPSCSTGASALNYTSASGFSCNTAVNAATLGGATFASPPAAGYGSTTPEPVAATTITATTPIGVASGGTGRATLTAHGVLIGEGTAAINQTSAGTLGQPLLSGGASADANWGTLGIAAGGTGAITAPSALANLGAAALAGNSSQQFNVSDATTANNAVAYDQALGLGQTWTDVHASRVLGTTYTNSTGRPIMVIVSAVTGGANGTVEVTLNSVIYFGTTAATSATQSGVSFIVPPGGTYVVNCTGGGTPSVGSWGELR